MYVFGVDIPLVELLFILVVFLIVIILLAFFWFGRLKREEREIVGLLDILMRLDKREIEHLKESKALSFEEKRIIEEVKGLRKIGVTKEYVQQIKPKKIAIKAVVHKIHILPSPEKGEKILAGIKKKIGLGLERIEKGAIGLGKGIKRGTSKPLKKVSKGISAAGKKGENVFSKLGKWINAKSAEYRKNREENRKAKANEQRLKESQKKKEEKQEEMRRKLEEKKEAQARAREEAAMQKRKAKKKEELESIMKELRANRR